MTRRDGCVHPDEGFFPLHVGKPLTDTVSPVLGYFRSFE